MKLSSLVQEKVVSIDRNNFKKYLLRNCKYLNTYAFLGQRNKREFFVAILKFAFLLFKILGVFSYG